MNCKDALPKIGPWLMGDLSPQEEQSLTQHLGDCTDCRRERERLEATLDLLSSLEEQPAPRSFFIPPESPQEPNGWKAWMSGALGRWVTAAAVALLVIAAAAAMGFRVQVDQGVLAAGFGPMPSSVRPADLDSLSRSVLIEVNRRIKRREEALLKAYRVELASFDENLQRLQTENHRELQRRLSLHISKELDSDSAELQRQLVTLFDLSYRELQSRYRQDIAGVGETIAELATRNAQQEENMEYLRDAVLFLATSGARSE